MKPVNIMAAIAAFLMPPLAASAETQQVAPKVGDEFEIIKSYETSQQASDGSSTGSSSGHDTILERVTAVRADGLELEYDLPSDATADDTARVWQFPARIFKPRNGPMQLLNGDELEVRLEGWLKAAKWTREICGRWIFTWNAFRIECDPQSVIQTIEAFDLRSPEISDGASYREPGALAPGTFAKKSAGPKGATFAAVMGLDPDAIRRERAEADVAVGEMLQKPVTLETALSERAKESISGTISVTFETDAAGSIWRRTKVTKLETKKPGGETESETATETVERVPVPRVSPQH